MILPLLLKVYLITYYYYYYTVRASRPFGVIGVRLLQHVAAQINDPTDLRIYASKTTYVAVYHVKLFLSGHCRVKIRYE